MKHTWRWFGPVDKVSVRDAAQAGAEGIVSALHHIPTGAVWPADEIEKRHAEIKAGGLYWDVVESVPVSEEIKTQTGDWREHIQNWITSMRHLRDAGLEVLCYNFMPVLDWTRTYLAWRRPNGARCMRFDFTDFAAFDIHILQRPGAAEDLPEESNRVTLDPELKDSDGLPAPKIRYVTSENTKRIFDFGLDRALETHETAGASKSWVVSRNFTSGHNLGTAKMGDDPATSVVNRYGRAHDVPNLFVFDGSTWPTSAGMNPTATIAALALRNTDALIESRRLQAVAA